MRVVFLADLSADGLNLGHTVRNRSLRPAVRLGISPRKVLVKDRQLIVPLDERLSFFGRSQYRLQGPLVVVGSSPEYPPPTPAVPVLDQFGGLSMSQIPNGNANIDIPGR